MDNETDISSHQTATSPVDTTTPVTSPDHSQQSDFGSGCRGKKRRMSWGWDGTSTMPTNSAPSASTPVAAPTPKTNSDIPNPIFSASCSHMDLDSIFPRYVSRHCPNRLLYAPPIRESTLSFNSPSDPSSTLGWLADICTDPRALNQM